MKCTVSLLLFAATATALFHIPVGRADDPQAKPATAEAPQVAGRTLAEWTDDLKSDNELVRLRATLSLGAFREPAVSALTAALEDPSDGVRYWAASELGDIGPAAKPALARLRKLNKEKFIGLRIAAAYALCRLGELDAGLPTLTTALESPERGISNSAVDFLARVGPPAKAAIGPLEQAAKQHDDYHVRGAALEALRRIRGDE